MRELSAAALIVGAGPVGLTLALDLAWRGVDSILVEQRAPAERATPRANHLSARAMEAFRRLGIADDVRKAGLPGDYPPDVVWATTMTGHELTRIELARGYGTARIKGQVDSDWPTPEPQHKINQMFLEPILRAHAEQHPRIRLLTRTRLDRFEDRDGEVAGEATNLDSGEIIRVASRFLIGCDGGASTVRKQIGAKFEGDAALTRVVSLHVTAPEVVARLPRPLAHRYFVVNHVQSGVAVTLDGRALWSFHVMLPTPDSDPAALDRGRAIAAMTGLEDLSYDVFAVDEWTGRRLLASSFRDGNVFLCGDAAHIWVPNAGYGMNAGIADAENLAWRLSAVLQGWGGRLLLDGYERERHPITDQVSQFAKTLAVQNRASAFRHPPPALSQPGAEGEKLRGEFGAALYALNLPQFTPLGLNFAYFYADSPNIAYDGEAAPAYGIGDYTPSTVPGCRAPHFFQKDGASLYDGLGDGYALLRFDRGADTSPLRLAAQRRGMPLKVLDVDPADAAGLYRHALVLVRPDRHVAWRGQAAPADPAVLVDVVCGG